MERILIIGATGYIGKYIAQESLRLGHPTFLLIRGSTLHAKAHFIDSTFHSPPNLHILEGSLDDYESLVKAIKEVDVVICTVGEQILAQLSIVKAIQEAGSHIKRFLPSEFGTDPGRQRVLEPAQPFFDMKLRVRKAIEEANIPYTYISSNSFAGYFLGNLVQPGLKTPPQDKVVILGNGNVKAIFVAEEDVATYTMKAATDSRTLNKIIFMRPAGDIVSMNEVLTFCEKKIGKTLEKVYVPDEEVLKQALEKPFPECILPVLYYQIFVRGDAYNFDLRPDDLEAANLYPDVKHTTVDQYLDRFV